MRKLFMVGIVFTLAGCSEQDLQDLRTISQALGSPQMQSYGQCVSRLSNERLPGGFLAYPGYSAFGACSASANGDDE